MTAATRPENRRIRRSQRFRRKHEYRSGTNCVWCGGGRWYNEEFKLRPQTALCVHCKMPPEDHAKGNKCLSEPTYYEEMSCKEFMSKHYEFAHLRDTP